MAERRGGIGGRQKLEGGREMEEGRGDGRGEG